MNVPLKRKYRVNTSKMVSRKGGGTGGGVGRAGTRRKRGYRKHGKTTANTPEIRRKMRYLEQCA
jgi:hypothetical protein